MRHTIRHARGGTCTLEPYARAIAIRAFCTECLGWETHPSKCQDKRCPLYPFRAKTRAAISESNRGQKEASASSQTRLEKKSDSTLDSATERA